MITERRGIYTNPPKKGKNNDAMFTNIIVQDEAAFQKMKEKAKEEHENYLKKVRERAEKQSGFSFRPGGPQEYKDL